MLSPAAAEFVVPAGVVLASFVVAEQGHRIVVAASAAAAAHIAAAGNQHCTVVAAVLARSLLVDRTWLVLLDTGRRR